MLRSTILLTGEVEEEEDKSLSLLPNRECVMSWKIAIFMMFKIDNKMKYALWQGQAFSGTRWKDFAVFIVDSSEKMQELFIAKDADIDRTVVESVKSTLDLK